MDDWMREGGLAVRWRAKTVAGARSLYPRGGGRKQHQRTSTIPPSLPHHAHTRSFLSFISCLLCFFASLLFFSRTVCLRSSSLPHALLTIMAAIADHPGSLPPDIDGDPFAPTPHDASHRQRYAGFDNSTFSLYSNGSPAQAKRALEAHLAETERRLQEASQLGSTLVRQRSELAEKLKEVQAHDEEQDIGPHMRQKLVDLEKEFNEVGKETARAFIPKPRIPSNESAKSDGAVFEAGGRESPSKVQPPSLTSRKQRNMAPGRVNDIKLATEISSSLLNQVRELQMAYADKDDALKAAMSHQSQLELEFEGLMQRLRALDESEQRYKDENWSLETRVQELVAAAKESNEREQRLQHGVKSAQSEKSSVERELEELKQSHGKLSEDHLTSRKKHEAELLTLKKSATTGESERGTLQRKIEDLTSQNQELAKAVAYKFHPHPGATREVTPEDDDSESELITPEHSPPPSPTKGTPRHGALESETLKSSLHHAHRMIQNLKNNVHREKTEKMELRRMLQDARDELEQRRADGGVGSGTKKRKSKDELKDFKKPARPDRLGGARGATSEIVMDDDWEDQDGAESPSRHAAGKAAARKMPGGFGDTTDAHSTENSDAFETATEHERETESEAFQTGAEDAAASGDDLTETERDGSTSTGKKNTRPSLAVNKRRGHERSRSYQSTASTSGDEFEEARTPIQNSASQKFKLKLSRGNIRGSAQRSSAVISDTSFKDSPASVASGNSVNSGASTPAGPSLFAELGDLDGSDDESSNGGTPSHSRAASREVTPAMTPGLEKQLEKKLSPLQQSESAEEPVKLDMVDSGIMTEPWQPSPSLIEKGKDAIGAVLGGGVGFDLGRKSKDEELETEPGAEQADKTTAPPVQLDYSQIYSQDTEPVEVPTLPKDHPILAASALSSQDTDPIKTTPAVLGASAISSQHTQPVDIPAVKAPLLGTSTISTQDTEPTEVPLVKTPTPALGTSAIFAQDTTPQTPVKPAEPATTPFSISKVIEQYASEPESPSVRNWDILSGSMPEVEDKQSLSISSVTQQRTEPAQATEVERPSTAKRIAVVEKPEDIPPVPIERPVTAAKDTSTSTDQQATPDQSSRSGFFSMFGLGKSKAAPATPPIAEDETSTKDQQPLRMYSDDIDGHAGLPGLEDTRTPMKEIEPNAVSDRSRKEGIALAKSFVNPGDMADEGTQTMMSAEDLDKLMKKRPVLPGTALVSPTTTGSSTKLPQSPTKAVHGNQSPRRSKDSIISADAGQKVPRRPGSSGSMRSRTTSPPPLPADHKQAIAAAARTSGVPIAAPTTPGSMGPPAIPASAYKRPLTATSSHSNTGTPRGTMRGPPSRSGVTSPVTRRSSVSSFASEIDQRFNITRGNMDGNLGFDSTTDPRMIQAITQTMIGEFLWKYTRKPGRGSQSSTRHRRFFWVHPYTRTLYWSEQDPATAGKAQLKAKSVRIQAVRVVSDDNPFPPGLHRKSIVVVTPGREIMFTAATSGRHETWFNALSYLLLRTGPERDQVHEESEATDGNLTAEDVDEFNPRTGFFGGATSKMSRRSRASLSSYNSRTTRASMQRDHPTLTPDNTRVQHSVSTARRSSSQTPAQQRGSISGRLSSLAGSVIGSSFASRYSGIGGQHAGQAYSASEGGTTLGPTSEGGSVYDASVVRSSHDSAEDLRRVIERQEREAHRLENVRACCDGKFIRKRDFQWRFSEANRDVGKHDVASLSNTSRRGRHAGHRFSTPSASRTPTHSVSSHARRSSQPLNAQA